MRRPLIILLLTALAGAFGACSQSPKTAAIPPFYVPAAMIAQGPGTAPAANAYANAYDVLPSSDAIAFWVPRDEKFAWGPMVYDQSSAYSIVTYDTQRISDLWGPSYRYRWIVQEGVTSP